MTTIYIKNLATIYKEMWQLFKYGSSEVLRNMGTI